MREKPQIITKNCISIEKKIQTLLQKKLKNFYSNSFTIKIKIIKKIKPHLKRKNFLN
jgi:hypothetical protein